MYISDSQGFLKHLSISGNQKKYLQQISDVAKTGRQEAHPVMRAGRYYLEMKVLFPAG